MDTPQIIHRYGDKTPIGAWSTVTEDGMIISEGVLLGETIKVRDPDGTVRLDRDWFPDSDENKS